MLCMVSKILILASLWPLTTSTSLCGPACEEALSYIKFVGNQTKAQCTNKLHIESYSACLQRYCPAEVAQQHAALQKSCKNIGMLPSTGNTTATLDTVRVVEYGDLYKKTPLNRSVLPSEDLFALSKRTIVGTHSRKFGIRLTLAPYKTSTAEGDVINNRYAYAQYGFWAVVLLIGGIARLYTLFLTTKAPPHVRGRGPQKGWLRTFVSGVRRHLTVPALAGKRTVTEWGTIPPRLQSLIILSFVAVNIALCTASYDVFPGNLRRPTIRAQVTRLIGRRTGVLIVSKLPLMWTFALRNNVLMWLSGWSFATFSSFHRWIARVLMAELVAHAVAYSLSSYYSGGAAKYNAQWAENYWRWGIVAITAGCVMLTSAVYPVRKRFYDGFLVVHIVLAVFLLTGVWHHIQKQGSKFDMYIWPCVAVWVFDRLMRYGRILALNRSVGRALIRYDQTSKMLHLTVPVRSVVRPRAGTYYFVYILHGTRFWESHPFTLASWSTDVSKENSKAGSPTNLNFVILSLDGFTGRLKDLATRHTTSEDGLEIPRERRVMALVEGPYGEGKRIDVYGSALIIVGGSGVSVAMSHLQSLDMSLDRGREIAIRKVRIVWAVRQVELAWGVLENDVLPWLASSGLATRIDIAFDIYVTRGEIKTTAVEKKSRGQFFCHEKSSEQPVSVDDAQEKDGSFSRDSGSEGAPMNKISISVDGKRTAQVPAADVRFHQSRPALGDICLEHAHRNSSSDARMALVCCGPPAMSDEVRGAVTAALKAGLDRIDYFPESFLW